MSKIKATKKNCSNFNEETLTKNFILRAMKNNPTEFLNNEGLSLILLFPNKDNFFIRILHSIYTTDKKFNIFSPTRWPNQKYVEYNYYSLQTALSLTVKEEIDYVFKLLNTWVGYPRHRDAIKNAYYTAYVLNENQEYNLRLLALSKISNKQIREKLLKDTDLYFDFKKYLCEFSYIIVNNRDNISNENKTKKKMIYIKYDREKNNFFIKKIDLTDSKNEESYNISKLFPVETNIELKEEKITIDYYEIRDNSYYELSTQLNETVFGFVPGHLFIENILDLGQCFDSKENCIDLLIKYNETYHKIMNEIFDDLIDDRNNSEKEFYNLYSDLSKKFSNNRLINHFRDYCLFSEEKLMKKYISKFNNEEITLDNFMRIFFKGSNTPLLEKVRFIKEKHYGRIPVNLYKKGLKPEKFNKICVELIKLLLKDAYMKDSLSIEEFENCFNKYNVTNYSLSHKRNIDSNLNQRKYYKFEYFLNWQFIDSIKKVSDFKILFKNLEIIPIVDRTAYRRGIDLFSISTPGEFELEIESKKILSKW